MALYDDQTGKSNARRGVQVKHFEKVGKNFHIIARRFLKNETLMRLLLINNEKALSDTVAAPDEDQVAAAFGDQIRTTPMIDKDTEMKNYIILQAGGFQPAGESGNYMRYFLIFDIICNVRSWQLNDYSPRPYRIMSEIDDMVGQTKIDALGEVQFFSANPLVINEEMAGFTLTYEVVSE